MRIDDFALVWKALADPTRRHLLDLMRQRPYTTGELAETLDISRYAVMKHLNTLEHSGLITVRKQGRERWNQLNPAPLQMIYERWLRPYEATWASALLQVKEIAEGDKQMADILSVGTQGSIHVELELTINAAPSQVFDALTKDIAAWWGSPYLSGEAANIVLEPKVGGRLYEVWGQDEGLLWATVVAVKRSRELRLAGSMMMPEPTYGVVRFQLEPAKDGTVVRLSHEAFGKIGENHQLMYSRGWQDLLDVRLRAFVERGIRHGIDQGTSGWRNAGHEQASS